MLGRVRRRGAFVPPGPARRALLLSLGINGLLAWAVLLGVYTFLERVWRGVGDRFLAQPLAEHLAQVELARRLQGLAWLLTAVLFLLWLYRVYANLAVLGASRLRFSPRWAVGTFLVPGVNLLWPFLVIREVWNASDPRGSGETGGRPPTSPRVAWWWITFVLASLLDPGFWRVVEDTAARLDAGGFTPSFVLAQLAEMAAAVLAITVVREIDRRQASAWAGAP